MFAEHNTIYITYQLDSTDRVAPLKKSTSDDNKLRFVRIPAATMNRLTCWIESNDIGEGQFVFTFDGKYVRKDYLQSRLKKALGKNKIDISTRWLTPYSFRYTFRSRMHGNLDLQTIIDMMGHNSVGVSENYLRVNPEIFKVFGQYQDKIDTVWAQSPESDNA